MVKESLVVQRVSQFRSADIGKLKTLISFQDFLDKLMHSFATLCLKSN